MIAQRILNPILNPILDKILDDGQGTGLSFYNLYGNLPVVLGANESAGLVTNADATGEPYGDNLQPNPDMSGTAGTTSGVGTVNGDVADDFNLEAGAGATITAGKTSNDYQVFYISGVSSNVMSSSSVTITQNEVWLAETYISGLVGTPQWKVTSGIYGATPQFTENLTGGYNRKIFTASVNITGGISFHGGDGEGCTIHWTRLRKLTGPSSALLTEVDRTLRANGTALWDADASVFTSGTYSWTADGGNSIANVGNELQITYVDSPTGARVLLKNAADLNTDLVIGETYQLLFDAYYTGGSSGVVVRLRENDPPFAIDTAPLTTTKSPYIIEFTATSTVDELIFFSSMSASNIVYLDNIYLQQMQPTAIMIERLDNAETFLIDNEPLDSIVTNKYTSDFSAGVDGWTDSGSTLTGNYDSGDAGHADTLRIEADVANFTLGQKVVTLVANIPTTVSFWYKFVDNTDIIGDSQFRWTDSGANIVALPTSTSWTFFSTEITPDQASVQFRVYCNYTTGNASNEVLIDTFVVDSNIADLELVKDGLTATMFYNNLIVDAEQTIDTSLQYNVIHSAYGDSTGSATIIPLRFGPTIATGTLTVDILYEIITTEVDHFGTGLEAGDYFISDGTETCDANNTVHAVNTS